MILISVIADRHVLRNDIYNTDTQTPARGSKSRPSCLFAISWKNDVDNLSSGNLSRETARCDKSGYLFTQDICQDIEISLMAGDRWTFENRRQWQTAIYMYKHPCLMMRACV